MKVSKSGLPTYVTTENFIRNLTTTQQGEISLSIGCTNSCVFCYTAHYSLEPSTQQIRYELMKAKEQGLDWINFTGGEPTLRSDFFDILDYANRLKFATIYIKTNGRKFKDMEFAKRFVGKVTYVHISIHGPNAEVHDRVTRTPGSFDDAVLGIKNLVSLGIEVTGMTVINKLNYQWLADTSNMLFDIGANHNSFAFPYPSGYAEDLFEEVVPRHYEVREDVWKALDVLKTRQKSGTVDNIPFCYLQGYERFANHLWFKSLANENHQYGSNCSSCIYRPICDGIPKYYVDHRGWDEFRPVNNQIAPLWNEPHELSFSPYLIPVASGRFLEQRSGGVIIGDDVLPLTREGYALLAMVNQKMTLKDLLEQFGDFALSFICSAYERGFLRFCESQDLSSVYLQGNMECSDNGMDKLNKEVVFEYPIYREHPPYPVVTLMEK